MNYIENADDLEKKGFAFNQLLTDNVLAKYNGEIADDSLCMKIMNDIWGKNLVSESTKIMIGVEAIEGERNFKFGIFIKEKKAI